MQIKYIVMAVFIFVIFHIALIPLGNEAINEETAENLNTIAYFGIPQEETTVGIIEYVKAPGNYFSSLYYVVTHGISGNPVFEGDYQMIGWIVVSPIVAGLMFGLILTFFGLFRKVI